MANLPVFATIRKLKNRIENYKIECDNKKRVPSMSGLALYCGISKKTLYNYLEKNGFSEEIEKFRTYCENYCLENALLGIIEPGMTKFYMKNELGYRDRLDVEGNQTINIVSNIPLKEVE